MKEIRKCKVCNTMFRPKFSIRFCSINCLIIHRKRENSKDRIKQQKIKLRLKVKLEQIKIKTKKQKEPKIKKQKEPKTIFLPIIRTKPCITCGKDIFVYPNRRNKTRYCSRECYIKSRRINICCIVCNTSFEKIKSSKELFCSDNCKYNYNLSILQNILQTELKILSTKKRSRKCKRCGIHVNNKIQKHHIIPRKYGGKRWKWNKILLCPECHNYVEIKTQEWIDNGGSIDVNVLRFKILNDAF